MSVFQALEAMDIEKPDRSHDLIAGAAASPCSICLELVLHRRDRSIAMLQCGHEFHLDCIGSAFNAKGAMQCPNCRKVEKGQWLYANGHRPSPDFDLDTWMPEDVYESYSELPFGLQWCPVRGLASLIEEGEHHLHSLFGDPLGTSSSTHVCPYLAVQLPHPTHPPPSSAAESIPENGPFHARHRTGLAAQFTGDMINSHSYSATEQQVHSWQQQPPLSYSASGNPDQSQLASRLSRADASAQQRVGSFVHPHTFLHGHVARPGSNMPPSLGQPVIGDVRGPSRSHGGPIYQQPASSSSLRPSPFTPIRRARPRTIAFLSSTVSSAEIGGFYSFSVAGAMNRSHQDGNEGINRNSERFYGWGREGDSGGALPWAPAEGESHWWVPPTDSSSRSFFPQRAAGERVTRGRPENGYHHMPLPQMPPYM